MFQAVYQSMRPAAIRLGLTTQAASQAFMAEITEATRQRPGVGMSPLLSAWKHKPPGTHMTDSLPPPCDSAPGFGPRP